GHGRTHGFWNGERRRARVGAAAGSPGAMVAMALEPGAGCTGHRRRRETDRTCHVGGASLADRGDRNDHPEGVARTTLFQLPGRVAGARLHAWTPPPSSRPTTPPSTALTGRACSP